MNEENSTIILKHKRKRWPKILGIIVAVFIIGFVILLACLPKVIMKDIMYGHFANDVHLAKEYGVEAETLTLSTQDQINIKAYLVQAEQPRGTVILLSGIQNPSVTEFFGYSRMLKNAGWNSLLVEMRAHGDSEGDMICFGMKEWLDVKAGTDYLKNDTTYGELPIVVWGTSMGGGTAINAIGEIEDIDGLISCSAFSAWEDVFKEYMMQTGVPGFICDMEKPFLTMYLKNKIGSDYINICAKNEIKKLNGRPALLMHSTKDTQVPYANFKRIMKNAPKNVETFIREGDHHFIVYDDNDKNPEEDTEFADAILGFLKKNFE